MSNEKSCHDIFFQLKKYCVHLCYNFKGCLKILNDNLLITIFLLTIIQLKYFIYFYFLIEKYTVNIKKSKKQNIICKHYFKGISFIILGLQWIVHFMLLTSQHSCQMEKTDIEIKFSLIEILYEYLVYWSWLFNNY